MTSALGMRARLGALAAGGLLAATVAAALAAAGCSARQPPADPPAPRIEGDRIVYAPAAAELAALSLAPARPAPVGTLRTTGRLAWDEDRTARVFAPVGGRVRRMLAGLEQRVAGGTPLADLESPDFGQAQADAAHARTDLAVAERNLARLRELYEHAAAPRKDLESAEADRDRAKVEMERTEAHLTLLGGRPGAVDQRFVLRSPIAGVVVERSINPGLEVRPDSSSPLFVVSDPERLWVYLDVVEQQLAEVRRGEPLVLRSNAFPQRSFPGTIEVLGDTLDPTTRTVKARGSVANPDRLLKAEMYVEVEIQEPSPRAGLEVPSAAVVAEGPQRYVFVQEAPGTFRRCAVTAGTERGGETQILSGLAAGQRVVVEGSLLLESLLSPAG